jgi:DHA1 family bicyclomycin/chloramphenicol resistance-like MFS transporter
MQPVALSLTLILGAMSAFGPLATDMYLPAFPVIRLGLGTDAGAVQRTLAAFFAGMALAQLVYGPLADRFGRKPPAMVGLAIFTAGSLGCALTSDVGWFTAWRFVQGIGGCAGMVMARAIVRDLTQGSASVRLMSQLMLVSGIAPILAPSIGSALLAVADWRAIFWLLALYSAGLAVVVRLGLQESLPAERRRKDGLGGVLQVYARLLGNRHFLGHALSGALPAAGMFAYIGGSPFVFMDLHGVAPAHYGMFFGLNAFGIMLLAQINARLARRIAPERALTLVLGFMATVGLLLLGVAATGAGGFPAIAALLFCYVACIGATMPLATTLAMGPQGRVAGSASALIGTLQFGLGALAGWMVGALHDGTAVPMALGVALAGVGGLLAKTLLAR